MWTLLPVGSCSIGLSFLFALPLSPALVALLTSGEGFTGLWAVWLWLRACTSSLDGFGLCVRCPCPAGGIVGPLALTCGAGFGFVAGFTVISGASLTVAFSAM